MRAIVIERLEGPSSAQLGELPEPEGTHERANGGRMLVEVHAAGLSAIDPLQARGVYQYRTPPPYAPGSEVAGIVLEAPDDSGFRPGDRVAGIVFWGGLAERCLMSPEYTIHLPDEVSFIEGAAVYMNYSTAWYAYHRAGVGAGQTVLVHGAAGGVGSAILDLAAVFGARVIAVVSTDDKAEFARRSGAWAVLRSGEAWLDDVRRLTEGRGVDAVLDPVGGDRFTDSLRSLRIGGTLVVIGFVGGIPEVKVNRLLLRNLTITGISMDSMDTERPGELVMVRDAVQRLLHEGRISPRVGEVFPFERSAAALERVEQGSTPGKVVVEVLPD